jgi:hypothetical protein
MGRVEDIFGQLNRTVSLVTRDGDHYGDCGGNRQKANRSPKIHLLGLCELLHIRPFAFMPSSCCARVGRSPAIAVQE